MKPADLRPVFAWEERKVMLKDRIWYVPGCPLPGEPFVFDGWQSESFFGNTHPVYIEYCSGNGLWVTERALSSPETNWIAVEKKWVRVRKIWSKIHNLNIPNLIGMCGEGLHWTETYVPKDSVDGVFINFPDPWPKKRHAKNRIITPTFLKELFRILKKGGVVTFVTDDKRYSEEALEVFGASDLKPVDPAPYYVTSLEGYGSSYFEDLWRGKGKEIRYHRFMKCA